jgi:hypothetical protein
VLEECRKSLAEIGTLLLLAQAFYGVLPFPSQSAQILHLVKMLAFLFFSFFTSSSDFVAFFDFLLSSAHALALALAIALFLSFLDLLLGLAVMTSKKWY